MKVIIEIPDNYELVKDGEKYIVKEKKQVPPRTWEEFCERNPIKEEECFMNTASDIIRVNMSDLRSRNHVADRNLFINEKEAEAFLALMQLRQLRKAWVGDWKQSECVGGIVYDIIYDIIKGIIVVCTSHYWANAVLSFPTEEMAKDFLECFHDLCETAKILL